MGAELELISPLGKDNREALVDLFEDCLDSLKGGMACSLDEVH